ncbi:MAG: lipopolysaccharide biosynthesis protein, partial [Acutalibacteraceae bacterium]
SFLQKGLSVITTPVFTRMMSVAEYGTYSLYISWYNIIIVFCTLNLSSGMINSFIVRNEAKKDDILSGVMGFQIINTLCFAALYGLYYCFFGPLPGLTGWMGCIIFIEVIASIPGTLWLVREKYENHYRAALIILAASVMNTIVSLAWVMLSDDKALSRIYGMLIGSAPFLVFYLFTLLKKSKKVVDFSIFKQCLLVGSPLILHYLSQSIMGQSDKLIIQSFYTKEDVAIYSMAHSISWLMYIFVVATNSTVMPWLYKKMKKNDMKSISNTVTILMLILCIMSFCVSIAAPELMLIFGGKRYIGGSDMIPPLVCTLIFIFLTTIFTNFEFYFQKTMVTAVSTIFGAVINIVLNYLFIPRMGPVAACYTTLFSYLVIAVIHYFALRKIIKTTNVFRFKDIVSTKALLIISVLFSVLIMSTLLLFEHLLLRILIGVVALVLAALFAKKWYTTRYAK